jgi:hypothetical protein
MGHRSTTPSTPGIGALISSALRSLVLFSCESLPLAVIKARDQNARQIPGKREHSDVPAECEGSRPAIKRMWWGRKLIFRDAFYDLPQSGHSRLPARGREPSMDAGPARIGRQSGQKRYYSTFEWHPGNSHSQTAIMYRLQSVGPSNLETDNVCFAHRHSCLWG